MQIQSQKQPKQLIEIHNAALLILESFHELQNVGENNKIAFDSFFENGSNILKVFKLIIYFHIYKLIDKIQLNRKFQ